MTRAREDPEMIIRALKEVLSATYRGEFLLNIFLSGGSPKDFNGVNLDDHIVECLREYVRTEAPYHRLAALGLLPSKV